MRVVQPFYLRVNEAPELPRGWKYLTTEAATTQLKPGKLFDKKTARTCGQVPVLSQGEADFIGFHDEAPGVFATEKKPVVTFANHTCAMRLMTNPFSCIQNIFPKVGKDGEVDTRYFFYAARGRVSLTDYKGHHPLFRQALIPVPPLSTQRCIASILGAYDDLIEVNRRRIAALEKMARGLFEEWFVRFRFPGHEQIAMTERKPNDWRLVKVGAVLQKFRRPVKVMKQEYEQGGMIPCIDQGADFIGGFTNNTDALITAPLPLCVFGDHTRVLKFITFPFASGADGTQLLYPVDDLTPEFLYFSLLNIDLSNQHYARHFKFLKDQEIWLPAKELIERFTMFVKPQMESVENIRLQNRKLAASRDFLLPRLISGQLSVTEAECQLEEVA